MILVETFLALMMLSIGITSVLGIFGNALKAGEINNNRIAAVREMDHVLFESFANPTGVLLWDKGQVTLSSESKTAAPELYYQIDAQKLGSIASSTNDQQNEYYTVNYRLSLRTGLQAHPP